MTTKNRIFTTLSVLGLALGAFFNCGPDCLGSVADAQERSSCTLPTESLAVREAERRTMLRAHDARLAGMTVRIALRGEPAELQRRVRAIALAEGECCSFLTIQFERTETGGIVELSANGEAAWTIVPMLEALHD